MARLDSGVMQHWDDEHKITNLHETDGATLFFGKRV